MCIFSHWRVFVLFAGTRRVRNDIRPLPNSTTGGHRWVNNRWSPAASMCHCRTHPSAVLCSLGHHLCVRHHMQVVLSAPGQVGEWCRRSKTISSLVSLSWTCRPSQRARVLSYCLSVGCLCSPHTRWLSVCDKMKKFLFSVPVVVVFAVCPRRGAEDTGREQVWRGAHEAGDNGPRKQGLIYPLFCGFVLLLSSLHLLSYMWLSLWWIKYCVGFHRHTKLTEALSRVLFESWKKCKAWKLNQW